VAIAFLICESLVFSHVKWGEEYPGDGQQAFGFIIIFYFISAIVAGFYFIVASVLHFFLRHRPWRWVFYADCFLGISLIAFLAFEGITMTYQDGEPSKPGKSSHSSIALYDRYTAKKSIDGYTIQMDICHFNGPQLLDPRYIMQIRRGNKRIAKRVFTDSDKQPMFYVLRKGSRLTVLNDQEDGLVLDTKSGTVSDIDPQTLPKEFYKGSLGGSCSTSQRTTRIIGMTKKPYLHG
jgi:hypothetical protein